MLDFIRLCFQWTSVGLKGNAIWCDVCNCDKGFQWTSVGLKGII